MYHVFFKNGYFNVSGDIADIQRFNWLTKIETTKGDEYYFHANPVTRKLFSQYMLHDPNCQISSEDLEYLRNLKLSGRLPKYDKELVTPRGHCNLILKPYQVECVYRMLEHKNYCMFLGPGTGKTLIAITYLMNAQPKRVLVLTPKKVIGQYCAQITKYLNYKPESIEVINFEQINARPENFKGHYDCMIIDESHRLKDYMSKTSQFIREEMDVDRMFLFTGTPQDKNRFEIFSQFALFDKRFMPTKSKFIHRYFEMDKYYKPTTEKRPEELTSMMRLVSCAGQSEDLITELPMRYDHIIKVKRPEPYKEFTQTKLIDKDGILVVCDTPSKFAIKLREMCNGFILDDNKNIVRIKTNKEQAFKELIPTLKNSIIYTVFDEDITIVSEWLGDLGRSYVTVNGKTKEKDAEERIQSFKDNKTDFLVIQVNSGAAGLDMTNTNNTMFYSLPTSYITYFQACYRTRRIGQKKDCHYYFLVTMNAIETHIMRLLEDKKSFNANLYSTYRIKKKEENEDGEV